MDKEHKQDKRTTKPDCAWTWSTGKRGINHCSCPKIVKRKGTDLTYPDALSRRLTGVFSHVFPCKSLSPLRVNAKWCWQLLLMAPLACPRYRSKFPLKLKQLPSELCQFSGSDRRGTQWGKYKDHLLCHIKGRNSGERCYL